MAATDTEMMARMGEWIDRKAESRKSADEKKRAAWELWKRRASYEDRNLLEILNGQKPLDWAPEREAEERKLFEEFWAEQTR